MLILIHFNLYMIYSNPNGIETFIPQDKKAKTLLTSITQIQ